MSFILDALRKSDKTRRQNEVPDLQSIHWETPVVPPKRPLWPLVLMLVLVINAGALLWIFKPWAGSRAALPQPAVQGADTASSTLPAPVAPAPVATAPVAPAPVAPAPVATAPAVAAPAVAAPAVAAPVVAAPAVAAPAVAAPVVAAPAVAAPVVAAPVVAAPVVAAPVVAAPAVTAPVVTALDASPTATSASSAAPLPPEPAASNTATAPSSVVSAPVVEPGPEPAVTQPQKPRIYRVEDLPASIKSSLPSMHFSLHYFTPDPGSRMVRINDRIMREGASLDGHLRLEEITTDGVVFSAEGYRFNVSKEGTRGGS